MEIDKRYNGPLYIIISFVLWLIAEYVTVWHSRLGEWMSLMPFIAIQYLLIILFFYYFIFRRKWEEKRVFILMLALMFVLEWVWQNHLLFNLALFIPVTILLISVWGFLTFIPFWFVEKTLGSHKKQAIFYSAWPLLGFIMALFMG